MEIGTLKGLNVQPGDVVEYTAIGEPYMTHQTFTFAAWVDGIPYSTDQELGNPDEHLRTDGRAVFRIISRANPPLDLTAITTPFGLLDAATQDALRAHGGPYEAFVAHGGWFTCLPEFAYPDRVIRVKPTPKRETVRVQKFVDEWGNVTQSDPTGQRPTVNVTFDRVDGEIDLSTYRVEAR